MMAAMNKYISATIIAALLFCIAVLIIALVYLVSVNSIEHIYGDTKSREPHRTNNYLVKIDEALTSTKSMVETLIWVTTTLLFLTALIVILVLVAESLATLTRG